MIELAEINKLGLEEGIQKDKPLERTFNKIILEWNWVYINDLHFYEGSSKIHKDECRIWVIKDWENEDRLCNCDGKIKNLVVGEISIATTKQVTHKYYFSRIRFDREELSFPNSKDIIREEISLAKESLYEIAKYYERTGIPLHPESTWPDNFNEIIYGKNNS